MPRSTIGSVSSTPSEQTRLCLPFARHGQGVPNLHGPPLRGQTGPGPYRRTHLFGIRLHDSLERRSTVK